MSGTANIISGNAFEIVGTLAFSVEPALTVVLPDTCAAFRIDI
ncbi:MAG: hypothetical protein ACOCX5_01185 [Chloroflexota bacterium]